MWERTIAYQTKLENRWKSWRKRAKDARRAKLSTKDLPELRDMIPVRNGLLIAIGICLLIPSFNVFTHVFDAEDTVDPFIQRIVAQDGIFHENRPWYYGLDVYAQALSLFFCVFAWVFDYSIWKRFGKEYSVLDYS